MDRMVHTKWVCPTSSVCAHSVHVSSSVRYVPLVRAPHECTQAKTSFSNRYPSEVAKVGTGTPLDPQVGEGGWEGIAPMRSYGRHSSSHRQPMHDGICTR